jgi:hypothetical protein
MPTTCKCGPCTHPAWKKPCAVKRSVTQRAASTSATGAGDRRKPWETEPNRADGWKLLELCGYGVDSAPVTWRKVRRSERFVPWPEALEALRELAQARSNKTTINERRARVIEELAAHLAASSADPPAVDAAPPPVSIDEPANLPSGSAASSSTDLPADPSTEEVPNTDGAVSGDPPAEGDADDAAPPPVSVDERVELPQELAMLLERETLPKVRRTPTGEYSLADIGMAITGKDAHQAAEDVRRTFEKFPEVGADCSHFQFSGQGQRIPTKVGNLAKVVEYIMLLPCKTAARVRVAASKILVRYLGGDLKLIEEVRGMRRVQEHLADVDPENWRRAFGEAVEHEASAPRGGGDEGGNEALRRARREDELDELQHRKKRRELELEAYQQKTSLELEILRRAAEEKRAQDRRAAEEGLAKELEIKQLQRQEAQEALQAAEERRRLQNLKMAAELVEHHGQLFGMSEADRVAHADLLRSATRASSAHREEPERGAALCLETYLVERGLPRSEAVKQRSAFGRLVLKAWQQEHPGERPPKKSIFCNGQEISANCYFEADRPVLDAAFEANRDKLLPPEDAPAAAPATAGFLRHFFRSSASG